MNTDQIMPAPTVDAEREATVLSALFRAVERMPRPEAQALLREHVAPAPLDLMADNSHALIWAWFKRIADAGQLPGIRTAVAAPELRGVPRDTWVQLAQPGVGALTLAVELATLTEIAARRTALQQLYMLQSALERGAPVDATINQGVQELTGLSVSTSSSHDADEYCDPDEEEEARKAGLLGAPISTGLLSIDRAIENGGMLPGQLVGIVGETGKGKTRFCLGLVTAALKASVGVTYCSMEQGESDSWTAGDGTIMKGHRTVANLARFAYGVGKTFRKTDSSQRRKRAGLELVRQRMPHGQSTYLRVQHDSMAIEDLEREGVLAALRGHKVMIIDNLEHVQGRRNKGEGDHRYVENICHDLARIAQRNKLVVVVLMQPNREAFGGDMPATLKQIADSFNATRPFDLILSLWRPSDAQADAYTASMVNARSEADVVRCLQYGGPHPIMGKLVNGLVRFAKVRGAGLGRIVECGWDEHVGRWHDLGDSSQPLPDYWQAEEQEAERHTASLEAAPVFGGRL